MGDAEEKPSLAKLVVEMKRKEKESMGMYKTNAENVFNFYCQYHGRWKQFLYESVDEPKGT